MGAKETGWNRNGPNENQTDKTKYLNKKKVSVNTDSACGQYLFCGAYSGGGGSWGHGNHPFI